MNNRGAPIALRGLPVLLFVAAALVMWRPHVFLGPAWDAKVYQAAIDSLRIGHDPYADAVVVQRAFYGQFPHHQPPPGTPVPFCYVYSPVTLPVLRLLAKLPKAVPVALYWGMYAVGTLVAIWFALRFARPESEREVLAWVSPAAIVLPGLLWHPVIFSGNVAYVVYGAVFLALALGLKSDQWLAYWMVVLIVACIKAPLLTLALIPVLCSRKQWVAMFLTGGLAVGIFLAQPFIWPQLYANYLTAVQLQFQFIHEFGLSPSGLLADNLYEVVPYQLTWGLFWLFCTSLFVAILFHLRRLYLHGWLLLEEWVPVMFCGVVLLNPRIMEYDVAAITLMLGLIAWRVLQGEAMTGAKWLTGFVALANLCAQILSWWRPTECLILVFLFFAGAWQLDHVAAKRSGNYTPVAYRLQRRFAGNS